MSELRVWEHPRKSKITIREKINAKGDQEFGLSYYVIVPRYVTGNFRIRKQFLTKAEAETWAEGQWRGRQTQGDSFFEASEDERREFGEVLPLLRDKGIGLRDAVEFAIERMQPAGGDKTVAEVVAELVSGKNEMLGRGILRSHSVRAFSGRSKAVVEAFGPKLLKDLTLAEVKVWLGRDESLSLRTRKNRLDVLSEILRYGNSKKYVGENVVDGLTNYDRQQLFGQESDPEPEILSVEDARRLITAARTFDDGALLGAVTLGLFCGLRTEELIRLDWDAVRLDERFVTVSPAIAKKRRIRNVTIPDNALEWLGLISERVGNVYRGGSFFNSFERLLRAAGFVDSRGERNSSRQVKIVWPKNGMRHSFGSYHFALHGNSLETATLLGHRQGDNVLFDHYRALATRDRAEAYFDIRPETEATPQG